MDRPIRILFLADSHLGLDLPVKPRVARRRRGHDFLANHERALAPALAGEVDLVVHGGDVFDRPRVATSVAHQAYAPIVRVADRGTPVYVVPGNHERGRLPHGRFLSHPRIHVFDRPRTFSVRVRGTTVTLAGFPYQRHDVRSRFPALLEQTGWRHHAAALRLLCIHHCVEGATVGPADFVFTTAADVIRAHDLPGEFHAVLSGHIHRHQVLTESLSGARLAAPVLYPGSIERTSTAEIGETKGYMVLELSADTMNAPLRWEFRELPARPMLTSTIPCGDASGRQLDAGLRSIVARAPADAVLVIRVAGELTAAHLRVIAATHLRSFTPATMNVEIRAQQFVRSGLRTTRPVAAPNVGRREENLQLEL